MDLMLVHNQQLDLSNLQISNLHPKNIVLSLFYVAKKHAKIQTTSLR